MGLTGWSRLYGRTACGSEGWLLRLSRRTEIDVSDVSLMLMTLEQAIETYLEVIGNIVVFASRASQKAIVGAAYILIAWWRLGVV